uniref:Uncharacterized protein n=1 Tax=Glossina palpalis gambiensis TaxID=67801 RepID=A0A1B0BV68_9MUSC
MSERELKISFNVHGRLWGQQNIIAKLHFALTFMYHAIMLNISCNLKLKKNIIKALLSSSVELFSLPAEFLPASSTSVVGANILADIFFLLDDFDVTNFSNLAAVPSKKWQTNSKPQHFGFYVYSTKTLKILKGIHVYLLCVKYYYIVTIPNLRQSNNQWCLCNQTELSPPTVLIISTPLK